MVVASFAMALATLGCSSSDFNVANGDGGTDGSTDDVSIGDSGGCTGTECPCADPTFRCGLKCVDRSTDVDHCGACAVKCPVPTGGTATCKTGICGIGCSTGSHACSGACVSDTSPLSCGTSSCAPCPGGANASPACTGGKCALACHTGFADCDGRSDNGCETSLNSNTDCGACHAACATGKICSPDPTGGFSCTTTCALPNLLCGTACVDVTKDPSHCGGCDVACASDVHGEPTCGGTPPACGVKCDSGFHACAGKCTSDSDATACGDSCTHCSAGVHATPFCDATTGTCKVTCDAGFADCDSDPTTCEADLNNDPNNCSKCGEVCTAPVGGTPTCSLGSCDFTCQAGWAPLKGIGCAEFGGAAEQNGAGGSTGCAPCQQPDPLGGGAFSTCGCPSGFTAETFALSLAVPCGTVTSGTSPLTFCYVPPPPTAPPAGSPIDFSGAYLAGDACSLGCQVSNPFTGACKCPAGSTEMSVDVLFAPACAPGTSAPGRFAVCVGPGTGPTLFGTFVNDKTGKCIGSAGSVVSSGTGTCGCTGGTAVKYPIALGTGPGALVICYP
jgi:hypothetical protein